MVSLSLIKGAWKLRKLALFNVQEKNLFEGKQRAVKIILA